MKVHKSETRTVALVLDLLEIQGWSTSKPPKGRLIRENEYKNYPELAKIFKGRSKKGKGDAYPDFLLCSEDGNTPYMVIEAKADSKDFDKSVKEACSFYGEACKDAGFSVVTVGVAGQEETNIKIGVSKHLKGEWKRIKYEGVPISWIPTPEDTDILLSSKSILDLKPVVPKPEILAKKADYINRILREAKVKDEYRPAYVGAMMLSLWQSKGDIRKNPLYVLSDINTACEQAFSIGGKTELAKSLHIDEANSKLATSAWRIISTLEKLNVVTASFSHDYLGQLYETFFRYTGGNTIGQYFTPRHITHFMADICEVSKNDIVIDPACGTGGFLIACIQRVYKISKVKYKDIVAIVRNNLIGYESEPITAALCVANMILRGDGKTGIRKADCLTAVDFPSGKCNVALMNPPFPHKKTDEPPQQFVERALEALAPRGRLAVILPSSLLSKRDIGAWRESILKKNTLLAVCQLPDELFQPYSSSTTSVVVIEKGVPHGSNKKTIFVRLQYDGLTLKKGARVERLDGLNQIDKATSAIVNKEVIPGFSGNGMVTGQSEWSPGAYIKSTIPKHDELKENIDVLLRRLSSFYVRYASEVANQRKKVKDGELIVKQYRDIAGSSRTSNAESLPSKKGTIGGFFNIFYGQKELHSRDGIAPGDSLIVSPSEEYNGCYGWLSFDPLIKPPFVTVAQTGSIGEAFVQLEPCGVNDDCLILLPKKNQDVELSVYFIAAAIIRLEKWRFNYGRKLTPSRICEFPMVTDESLKNWVKERTGEWSKICESAVKHYS